MTKMTSLITAIERTEKLQLFALFLTQSRHQLRNASALRRLAALILAILVPMIGSSQASQASSGATAAYTLKMDGDLVILNATVVDPYDLVVAGLNQGDFQVYEDGVLQQIATFSHDDIPVTVGILVDNSGSMRSTHSDAIVAALAFARTSNPHDQMFVVNFGDHASLGLPADIPFTDRRDQLQLALSEITANGPTALFDGVAVGLDHLKQGDREKKVLILISDGGDNASQHTFVDLIDLARHSGVMIYTIGIYDTLDGDRNPGVLRRLAAETGGEAFFPRSSNDIVPICEEVARRIRSQYTLSYVPTSAKRDDRYRVIQVKASEPGLDQLSVRTRAGYSMPSESAMSAAK
jgi:VWFA-related protein